MYHINSTSPFYLLNPGENGARQSYYGINATPSSRCDGVLDVYPTTANLQSAFNQRTNLVSPLDIDLFLTVDNTIQVEAEITSESNFTGSNLYFRAALIAYELTLQNLTYEYVLLDYAPNPTGLVFSINPSSAVNLEVEFPIPTITGLDNIGLVTYVQNDVTKEILQAKFSILPVDYPGLELSDYTVIDETGGNGNGLIEPGEECEMWVELAQESVFAPATGISAVLSTQDPDITITDGEATFPDIGSGGSGNNQDNPFTFQASSGMQPHNTTFRLDISANGGAFSATEYFTFMAGIPAVFLVDDDGNNSYEEEYIDTFEELDLTYDIWSTISEGTPSGTFLANYPVVIWFTGRETSTLSAAEQSALTEYLDAGGKLFISSENLGENIGTTNFYQNYIHAEPEQAYINIATLSGENEDPISSGTTITLYGGAYTPDSQSSIIPDSEARRIYRYLSTTSAGALSYSWDYMLVYAAFPFECVAPEPPSYTHRSVVLNNILEWFDSAIDISLPQTTAASGEDIEIDLSSALIESANPITSFDFEINFDPDVLELAPPLVSFEGTIVPSDWMAIPSNPAPGVLSVVAFGSTGLTGEGIICKIHFNVIGGENDYSELEIASFGYNQPLPIHPIDGWLNVSGMGIGANGGNILQPQDFRISSISPNPFNPEATISLEVPQEGEVSIALYNLMGEKVQEVFSGLLDTGIHKFGLKGEHLSSGMYLVSAKSTAGSATAKVILLK